MTDMLVVDCSVAAKWALHESDRSQALRLLDEHDLGKILLIAPDLLLIEFAGLIAKRSRRKQMSDTQARYAFHFMEQSNVRLFETRPLLGRALELALNAHMSLWDCVYVALAVEHDCELITADRRLFKAGAGRHPAIKLLA